MKTNRKIKKAFSLVEIILVISMIAILSSGAMLTARAYMDNSDKRDIVQAELDILQISIALSAYAKIEGVLPKTVEDLFVSGYLLGTNSSPFKTRYELKEQGDRMHIVCIGPEHKIIGM